MKWKGQRDPGKVHRRRNLPLTWFSEVGYSVPQFQAWKAHFLDKLLQTLSRPGVDEGEFYGCARVEYGCGERKLRKVYEELHY